MKKLILSLVIGTMCLLGIGCVDADGEDDTVIVDPPDTTIVEPPADVDVEIDGD